MNASEVSIDLTDAAMQRRAARNGGTSAVAIKTGPGIAGFDSFELIGSGGTSKVYKARDIRLRRWVAIKLLEVPSDGSRAEAAEFRERFRRECRLLGAITDHPHIVSVYESEISASGEPYMVMQLCSRGSAKLRLRERGPVEIGELLDLGVAIGGALAAAHGGQPMVLHRDIKPENILFTPVGRPVLADFGGAGIAIAGRAKTATMTPSHVAPEVACGRPYSVASEVYSFASTLYELAEGHSPFYRAGQTIDELLNRTVGEDPNAPTRADLPPEFVRLLMEGLAKDPSRRPATIALFVRRLQSVQERLGIAPSVFWSPWDALRYAPPTTGAAPATTPQSVPAEASAAIPTDRAKVRATLDLRAIPEVPLDTPPPRGHRAGSRHTGRGWRRGLLGGCAVAATALGIGLIISRPDDAPRDDQVGAIDAPAVAPIQVVLDRTAVVRLLENSSPSPEEIQQGPRSFRISQGVAAAPAPDGTTAIPSDFAAAPGAFVVNSSWARPTPAATMSRTGIALIGPNGAVDIPSSGNVASSMWPSSADTIKANLENRGQSLTIECFSLAYSDGRASLSIDSTTWACTPAEAPMPPRASIRKGASATQLLWSESETPVIFDIYRVSGESDQSPTVLQVIQSVPSTVLKLAISDGDGCYVVRARNARNDLAPAIAPGKPVDPIGASPTVCVQS